MSLPGPVADIDSITADTESERKHLPAANSLNNKLLLADAGYISHQYFADVTKAKRKLSGQRESKSQSQSTGSLPTGTAGNALGKNSRISIGEAAEPRFWIWM